MFLFVAGSAKGFPAFGCVFKTTLERQFPRTFALLRALAPAVASRSLAAVGILVATHQRNHGSRCAGRGIYRGWRCSGGRHCRRAFWCCLWCSRWRGLACAEHGYGRNGCQGVQSGGPALKVQERLGHEQHRTQKIHDCSLPCPASPRQRPHPMVMRWWAYPYWVLC